MSTPLASASSRCRLANEPGRALLTVRGQHLVTDSPPMLGGPNEAVNPAELFLCALSACATFIVERAAAEMGIPLASVDVVVAGDFDPRGVCGEPFDPRFQAFRVRIAMSGPDAAQARALVTAFETRCPVYATLRRAATVEVALA
jgi:uncharacterized OsmC-like protein